MTDEQNQMDRDSSFDEWWAAEPVSEFDGIDAGHVERAFAAGRKAERLYQIEKRDSNNCETCQYKQLNANREKGHCYMFAVKPEPCLAWKGVKEELN